jgi:hypothetical protein
MTFDTRFFQSAHFTGNVTGKDVSEWSSISPHQVQHLMQHTNCDRYYELVKNE